MNMDDEKDNEGDQERGQVVDDDSLEDSVVASQHVEYKETADDLEGPAEVSGGDTVMTMVPVSVSMMMPIAIKRSISRRIRMTIGPAQQVNFRASRASRTRRVNGFAVVVL
jgi:hypothetical protein